MPHLILVEKGSGKTHRIEAPEAIAGRDPSCPIFLEGDEAKTVSGRHARFFLDDTRWCVEDHGSRNGTYIGTRKLESGARHTLAVGDVVGLGMTGTQLSVREVAGRPFAATMVEAAPAVASPAPSAKDPSAAPAAEHVRVVLRGQQSGSLSTGQGDRITIGRALECLIRIEGEAATSVSRVHAEVNAVNGVIWVRDGGSRHGTFVNGKKIEGSTPLKAGDTLMLGPGGPTFTVDEAIIVPASSASSPASAPTFAGGTEPGPTGVRNAVKTKPSPIRDSDEVRAEQPTPGLDQPAFRKSERGGASARPASATAAKGVARSRSIWMGIAALVVVGAGIGAFAATSAKGGGSQTSGDVKQQAAELEAIRSAAVSDSIAAKTALDSATSAGAPAALLDSLRNVLTAAEQRSANAAESLRRGREGR